MNLANSIAGDLITFDGAETVTLITAGGVSIVVSGVIAREFSPGPIEVTANVLTSELSHREFHMMTSSLGSQEPAAGDAVVDSSGRRWRVQTSRLAAFSTRYHLVCTREA